MMNEYKIIAVDFDGTLCSNCYPQIGVPNFRLIRILKDLKKNGKKLILWTCRSGTELEQALAWCRKMGVIFDAVNDNLPEITEQYRNNSRKIFADVYIDDKACFPWEQEEKEAAE